MTGQEEVTTAVPCVQSGDWCASRFPSEERQITEDTLRPRASHNRATARLGAGLWRRGACGSGLQVLLACSHCCRELCTQTPPWRELCMVLAQARTNSG